MTGEQERRFDHIDDIYERLGGDARRHHVPAELLEIKSQADLERARQIVNEAIDGGLVAAAQLSKRTNIKPTAISSFRRNKWKGAKGTECTTASTLVRAIDDLRRQQAADETSIEGFVTTRFVEAVLAVVMYVVKRRKIGAFVAGAGTGKSTVLGHVHEETPGAILVTTRHCRSSPKSFLQLWARALGLGETGRAEDVQDRIIDCLAGSDRLTLIDEAHKLTVATLDVIREVWDQAKTPIVMAGTPSFHTTLTSRRVGVQSSELMDQLYSRVGIYRDLTMLADPETGDSQKLFTSADIRKAFHRGHVRLVRDGVDLLCRLANAPGAGGLRTCADLVQVVVDLFPGQEVSAANLGAALQMKVGAKEEAFRMGQAGVVRVTERPATAAAG